MKHRLMSIICLTLLIAGLFGDELADSQQRLERINREMREAQQRIDQNEASKRRYDSDLRNKRQTKQQTDAELARSQQLAREKLLSLNTVRTELRTVEQQIRDLTAARSTQIGTMVRVSRRNQQTGLVGKEQHCLALMVAQTSQRLNDLNSNIHDLTSEQNIMGREYSSANKKFSEVSSQSQELDRTVRSLEAQTSNLTREQRALQTKMANLKRDASRLETLIANLASQPRSTGQEPTVSRYSARTIAWPLRGTIIRNYGQESRAYNTSVVSNGIDIAASEWTSVAAAGDGEVIFSGSYEGQGKLLIIDHKNGFYTVYAYNNQLLVSTGSNVTKGQIIAKSGMTGSASEPSLHFEVRRDGKAVNPLSYLE